MYSCTREIPSKRKSCCRDYYLHKNLSFLCDLFGGKQIMTKHGFFLHPRPIPITAERGKEGDDECMVLIKDD